MGNIYAKTTHTVTISWDQSDPLKKGDLIRALSDTLPDSAVITGLSVADIPVEEPREIAQAAKRTLTITYVTDTRDLVRR
jgi:hypothetical protein|nr:MAG TPA: hypothetical protein [Caudoviricetes sp.]